MKSKLLVALLIALISVAPLTYPGPLQTHNGFTPLYALMGDAAATRAVGALPLGAASLLAQIGLAPEAAWKWVEALALFTGAGGLFALARRLYGHSAALVASVVYALLPYTLMTLYIRGEVGETLFLGLLPWIGYTFVASHSSLPESRPKFIVRLIVVGLATIALWKLCVLVAPEPAQAQAHLFQIFSARWDWGTAGDWRDAVPLQLGIVPVGLGVLAMMLHPTRGALGLGAVALGCCLLSIVPFSAAWPWQAILNTPWQLLGIAGLCLALLAGSLVAREPQLQSLPALAGISLLALLAVYGNLAPRGYDYVPDKPAVARFADEAYLVDARAPALRAGTTVTLTLWWQDLGTFKDDYKVFVHVIDTRQRIWTQSDAMPVNGTRPTRGWQRGELLRDDYTLAIPADAPAGLQIELGLYRSSDGARMATTSGDDRVIVKPLSIDE